MRARLLITVAVLALGACTTTTTTEQPQDPTQTTSALPVDLLHDPGAARKAIAAIEDKVGVETAQVAEIDVYGEYLVVEVQDPEIPEHLDQYTWRDGVVEPASPVHLSGPQEEVDASLFPTTAIDLTRLAAFVKTAEDELEHAEPIRIEQARASYLFIERSSSLDGRVTIRISIEGPRRSGSVEMTSSGEILEATVS
jgi:hypothetical protein